MYCESCGKLVGNSKFCPNCGYKLKQEQVEENFDMKNNKDDKVEIEETNLSNNDQGIESNKKSKKSLWKYAVAGIIIYLVISLFTNNKVTDSDYISCSKTVISGQLKAPSTAKFSNGEVIDKDKYGRAFVLLTVDAQNGFGVFVRNNYAVIINSYDKRTGEFTYYKTCVVDLENDKLLDSTRDIMKISSKWGEPIGIIDTHSDDN